MSLETLHIHEVGQIKEIRSCVAKITGISHCINGGLLEITPKTKAMILGFVKDEASVLLLGATDDVKVGDKVYSKQQAFNVRVGPGYVGRIVNALAEPMDAKREQIACDGEYFLFREAPSLLQRVPLTEALETGILIIDSCIPIGKGQRELIVGDRMLGKSSICTDAIINQKGKDVICIYCCIGRSYSTLERIVQTLKKHQALDYSIIVSATASSSVGEQYLAPYMACTLGEYFMDKGRDVLVIFDDLSKHAWAYRQISLLLERSPGRDAYPGDVFYLHSQLMERAGRYSPEFGSGTMTFLPIVETIQGDITGYIPSNLVSMTDGQIYLNQVLFSTGIKPAVDLGLSVSRIGNKVQCLAMRQLSGMLRLEYIQYQESLKIAKLKTGASDEFTQRLRRGEAITQIFKQRKDRPYTLLEELFLLYALRNNFLDVLTPLQVEDFILNINDFAQEKYPLLIDGLLTHKALTPEITQAMYDCLAAFFKEESDVK